MKEIKSMIIGIDFDGTCVEHEYPYMGKENSGATEVLRELVNNGHLLILVTMRGHFRGGNIGNRETNISPYHKPLMPLKTVLDDAIEWFVEREIPLYGVNSNPTQSSWTSTSKVFCDLYIDDAGLGVPLKAGEERRRVDWEKVDSMLVQMGAYRSKVLTDINKGDNT